MGARAEVAGALSTKNIFRLETSGVMLVCLSCLDANRVAQIHFSVRRIRRKFPDAIVLLGFWNSSSKTEDGVKRIAAVDFVAHSFREAIEFIIRTATISQKDCGRTERGQAALTGAQ